MIAPGVERSPWLLAAAAALIAAVIYAVNLAGLWWVTVLGGLALGLLCPSWRGLLAATAAGLLGWGLGLAWVAVQAPLEPTASKVTGTLGAGSSPTVSILFTVLLGGILALVAAWVGLALRAVRKRP